MNCDPFVKKICSVPEELVNLLKLESIDLTVNTKPKTNSVFYKSRSKCYHVSKYSEPPTLDPSPIKKILDWICKNFQGCSVFWAAIISINPNQRYPVHVDSRLFHPYSKRLHIPIDYDVGSYHIHFHKNNEGHWEDTISLMEVGYMYEFDNQTPHSAENLSINARKILVVDIMETNLLESRSDWLYPDNDIVRKWHGIHSEFSNIENYKKWTYESIKNEDND